MPVINKSIISPYSQQQMFELVDEVEKYPEFVPHCVSCQILHRDADEVRAELTFAHSGLHKSFATLNRLQPHKMIEIKLVSGPFSHLEGFWAFEAIDSQYCKITLSLEFEFSSKLLSMMFGPVFNQVMVTLVEAFSKRAEQIYGET